MGKEEELEKLIEKAKEKVEKDYDPHGLCKRQWLEATPPNSYRSKEYKVTVFVLEGSPPKGYIIVDYCYGIVKAFTVRLQPLYTYKVENKGCI